ncbi:hypothetical protein B0H21DRAFT_764062 [Amylocystis lapponica]|nr:hypothetical protein B0H21DRAFT_764062 [Amylocystis lapponica]
MAMAVQLSPPVSASHPTHFVEGHHMALRRSLRVRRLTPRAAGLSVTVENGPAAGHDPSTSTSSTAHTSNPRSRSPRTSLSGSPTHRALPGPSSPTISSVVSRPPTLKFGASCHTTTPKSGATPSNKRRRTRDLPDPPPLPATPLSDDHFRTPRALRALKRQRLSFPSDQSHTSSDPIDRHADSSSPRFRSRLSTNPDGEADHTSISSAVPDPLSPNSRQLRKTGLVAEHREHASQLGNVSEGARAILSVDRGRDSSNAFANSTASSSHVPLSDHDDLSREPNIVSFSPSTSELSRLPSVTKEQDRLSPSELIVGPSDSNDTDRPSRASDTEPASLGLKSSPSLLGRQLARAPPTEAADLPDFSLPPPRLLRDRIRRPENCDSNIWKVACQERVQCLERRYGKDTIRAVVAMQARAYTPRPRFCHYTPAGYCQAESDFMDVDSDTSTSDGDDEDLDEEVGEDGGVDCSLEPKDGQTVFDSIMDVAVVPGATSGTESRATEVRGDGPTPTVYSFPATAPPEASMPMPGPSYALYTYIPHIPCLSSIRVPYLEPTPFVSPEGKAFMGRGTPVDRQRLADWSYCLSAFGFGARGEEWTPMLFLPSVLSAPAASPPPARVSLMSDLDDLYIDGGLFPGEAALLAPYPEPVTPVGSFSYSPTPSEHSWLDIPARPSTSAAGLSSSVDPLTPDLLPAPPTDTLSTASSQTGCAWHSSFLQCLLGTGVGSGCSCMPCAPAMPAVTPAPALPAANVASSSTVAAAPVEEGFDMSLEQAQLQASSTLSHALG